MQRERAGSHGEVLSIDCQTCRVRPVACSDCVVSVLLGTPSEQGLETEELRALSVLADSGLVPPLRLRPPGSGKMVG
jgi:hypothetical protein